MGIPFFILRVAGLATAAAACAMAQGRENLSIPPSAGDNFFEASFRIRAPDASVLPRAVLLLVPGTDGDARPWADERAWKDFARDEKLVLIGCHFRGDGVEAYDLAAGGSGPALLKALEQTDLPKGTGPLPLLIFGHSAGAQFAFQMARWKPERVLAYAAIKGGGYLHDEGEALPPVPALIVAGEHDEAGRRRNAARLWEALRLQGSPACFLLERGQGHGLGAAVRLAQAFFSDVLRAPAQLPSPVTWTTSGGIGDGKVRPAAPGDVRDPARAWLPGDAFAPAWTAAHLPVRLEDLKQARDAEPPRLSVEPSALDAGDLAAHEARVVIPFAPRLDPSPEKARWTLTAASPHIRVVQERSLPPQWRIEADWTSQPWGHVHGRLWLTAPGTGLDAEMPVRAYLRGPWLPSPRSLYFGVMEAGHPPKRKVRLQPQNALTEKWQRIESTGPVPLDIRTFGEGASTFLEVTPRPGAYRGRFAGEIRLWMVEGKAARCLRIPCFGLVAK